MRSIVVLGLLAVSSVAAGADLPEPDALPSRAEPPSPFVMLDGTPVTTPQGWYEQRRPELKRLFQHYVYGYLPPTGAIETKVTKTVPDLLGGKATLKEVEIRFPWLTCDRPPVLHLAVFLPNDRRGKVPVFLSLDGHGPQAILKDDRITPSSHERDPKGGDEPGATAGFWCVDLLIERGYGLAIFHQSDVDPDQHDFTDGLHACLDNKGVPPGAEPGTIAAWAWGLHRAVDYLVTDADVDPKAICLIGHSRRGKTALFAAAMDERIALVVPHQSGTGGMALSRGNDQESVERINRVFPHWFDDNFVKFGGHEDRLPVDQHLLVALVAPRPLLDTEGARDPWANFGSALRTLQAAEPVYEFLGERGLVGSGVLTDGQPMTPENTGELLQYRLDKKHQLDRDFWNVILDFADLRLGRRTANQ